MCNSCLFLPGVPACVPRFEPPLSLASSTASPYIPIRPWGPLGTQPNTACSRVAVSRSGVEACSSLQLVYPSRTHASRRACGKPSERPRLPGCSLRILIQSNDVFAIFLSAWWEKFKETLSSFLASFPDGAAFSQLLPCPTSLEEIGLFPLPLTQKVHS